MNTIQQRVYEELIEMKKLGPRNPFMGICHNTSCPVMTRRVVKALAYDWPKYSGVSTYPVPHPELPPKEGYVRSGANEMWVEGEYARNRRGLLDYCIAQLKDMPPEVFEARMNAEEL